MEAERRKRIVEMVLLCAQEPVGTGLLRRVLAAGGDGSRLPGEREVRESLDALREDWEGRALELAETAGGWQFRTRLEYREYAVAALQEKPPRMGRALLEVLSVIAYHQPATRGDIERIRGVSVFPNHIRQLEDNGWIEPVGRRETPGRPVMYGTTKVFLDDLGLASLGDLPPLDDEVAVEALLGGDGEEEAPQDEDAGEPARPEKDAEEGAVGGDGQEGDSPPGRDGEANGET